ncbi:50S ribosomal protein L21 [Tessaracoccus sp. ZS01]|nr:50S ribosomal protein L21 [Tessaracoccus sp. ZS01]
MDRVEWSIGALPPGSFRVGHPRNSFEIQEGRSVVYAIVRNGGRQHKVAVGDVLDIDLVSEEVGGTVTLQPLLLVDGDKITSDAKKLGKVSVTAEVLGMTKGPKIRIMKYKNKTGYKKRQGHRQRYTQVKVTDIKA